MPEYRNGARNGRGVLTTSDDVGRCPALLSLLIDPVTPCVFANAVNRACDSVTSDSSDDWHCLCSIPEMNILVVTVFAEQPPVTIRFLITEPIGEYP